MNVDRGSPAEMGPALWERHDMREALASRDIAAVYRRLQACGVSQRRIAARTGQSAAEVYEILNGRQVMAYDVLVRIADWLGVPRGYLGLAYDEVTEMALGMVTPRSSADADGRVEVRALLKHAAGVTMGASAEEVTRWWQPVEREATPAPLRIGLADVEKIEAITAAMRILDYRHGGGACRDAVVAQARWAQQLLDAEHSPALALRLHVALADLHNLAGWVSFDVGLYTAARRHFARALEQAQHGSDTSLVADVLYRMGRLHLHRGWPGDALKFFQLGQIAAQDCGCGSTVAMLCANEAWAYSFLGDLTQAMKSLGRANDEFARANPECAPVWVRFFGPADLHALTGMASSELFRDQAVGLARAVEEFGASLAARGPEMTRSRVSELSALATVQLRLGDLSEALETGREAVALAEQVRSIRTLDRLAPLESAARARQSGHDDLRDLAERIAALRVA
jgi:tetratricopeptide (TPR) repeat protein